MAKIFRAMGQEAPRPKRIMEVNPDHPVLSRLRAEYDSNRESPLVGEYAELLYGQALLAEGAVPDDPARFGRLISDLMVRAIG
jgi:molecular chaperone HtpG